MAQGLFSTALQYRAGTHEDTSAPRLNAVLCCAMAQIAMGGTEPCTAQLGSQLLSQPVFQAFLRCAAHCIRFYYVTGCSRDYFHLWVSSVETRLWTSDPGWRSRVSCSISGAVATHSTRRCHQRPLKPAMKCSKLQLLLMLCYVIKHKGMLLQLGKHLSLLLPTPPRKHLATA